jgi:hypothetical protein
MFEGKIYVPKNRELRCRIMEQHHDIYITGYAGHFKILKLVLCNYWWPQMSRYIGIYVKTCDLCNQTKMQYHRPYRELHPAETPADQWDIISANFIVKLPQVSGYDAIIVVIGGVTKRAHFIPTHTTLNAEESVRLYLKEV